MVPLLSRPQEDRKAFSAMQHACHRGVLPAVSGQFVSHGLRTFAYEGSLVILKAITGGAAELQVLLPLGLLK